MSDRARAVVFGEDAATYERSRPGYPRAAIRHLTGLVSAGTAVEVGAGTGKATVDVAREGLALTCLEPSAEMAAILESKALPGVLVLSATWEEWMGTPDSTDLVYAAQAWHWVDRSTAYSKARSILRPGGALALMWNVPLDRYAGLEDVYSRHAPHLLTEQDGRIMRRDSHDWLEDMHHAGFTDLHHFTHDWSADLTPAEVRSLYSTYSDHMMLAEPARTELLDGLAEVVTALGGELTLDYRTSVYSGRA